MREEAKRIAAAICRYFEGLYLRPYLCPAGIPTIGLGTTEYPDGRRVRLSDPEITPEQAEEYLAHHLEVVVLPALARLCPELDTAGRLAALMSWVHNLGPGNLRASTLRRRITARQWHDVPAQIRRWVYGGGRRLRGLERRRRVEASLI